MRACFSRLAKRRNHVINMRKLSDLQAVKKCRSATKSQIIQPNIIIGVFSGGEIKELRTVRDLVLAGIEGEEYRLQSRVDIERITTGQNPLPFFAVHLEVIVSRRVRKTVYNLHLFERLRLFERIVSFLFIGFPGFG